jgi:hypothetical protein
MNNPSRYTDPSGHKPCEENGDLCLSEEQTTRIWKANHSALQPIRGENKVDSIDKNCSWSGAFSGEGCDLQYMSLSLGLDAPTLMMLSGLVLLPFAPEIGTPLGLAGAVFEACAFTATPLCAAVKLASLNVVLSYDKDGNFYAGPQFSWGKSILPFGTVNWNGGIYPTEDGHIPSEAEMEDSIQGFSVSAGTIATGGISYSPFAEKNQTAYYLVGVPEFFSINVQYNWLLFDFLP